MICTLIQNLQTNATNAHGQSTAGVFTNALQVEFLLVGCANEEAMVDQRIVACFEEKVAIPLPNARERRIITRTMWTNEYRDEVDVPYPQQQLDTWADNCTSTPIIPLLYRARQMISSLKLESPTPETATQNLHKTTKESKEPFNGVSGLKHVKQVLIETVLWPRRYPHIFRSFAHKQNTSNSNSNEAMNDNEITAPVNLTAGILLFGPPGMYIV